MCGAAFLFLICSHRGCSGWTSKLTSMPDSTTAERESVASTITNLAEQLVWMLDHLSPVESDLDVGQFLHVHKNKDAVNIAQRQCGAIRGYSEGGLSTFNSAVENSHRPSLPPVEKRFVGCMPVSFQRHHLETVQKGDYYVSEKTDGVRYLMVFTGSSAVLLDRTMQGWAPIPSTDDAGGDPFLQLAQCVAPGTVFDGEVVINRKSRRAQFIIFDVLCYGGTCLTRHKFSERLRVLKSNDWLDANNSGESTSTHPTHPQHHQTHTKHTPNTPLVDVLLSAPPFRQSTRPFVPHVFSALPSPFLFLSSPRSSAACNEHCGHRSVQGQERVPCSAAREEDIPEESGRGLVVGQGHG